LSNFSYGVLLIKQLVGGSVCLHLFCFICHCNLEFMKNKLKATHW